MAQSSQHSLDRNDIIELCTSFGWLFDQQNWSALTELFADEVIAGSPGEQFTVPRRQLVDGWSAQVARARSVHRQITDHLVVPGADGTAVCTAKYRLQLVGSAVDRDPRVETSGHYRFELRRTGAGWRIAGITDTVVWRSGDPAVAARPGDEAQQVARRFLNAISARDLETAFACLADDVVMDMPLAPPGAPTRLVGDQVRALYTGVAAAMRAIDLPIVRSEAFADPQWALVEYLSKMILPNGADYTNHYYGMFQVVDGRITVLRELYDTYAYAEQVPAEMRFAGGEGESR
ncbi:nuclear transport factor 2 family protein [Kitasatospora sp. RB6PN24]|uniref:nuclear transport factor 2 family protein n=1 Tax=Kitasatospora humi TaxID=2893891 RepID=UPI001E43596E|nr:nuclear transport factor 2 family protein [Kitasatospora humi]MCC9307441.1 nuclear transport factor 2 family protein [Kitasatospora humi]